MTFAQAIQAITACEARAADFEGRLAVGECDASDAEFVIRDALGAANALRDEWENVAYPQISEATFDGMYRRSLAPETELEKLARWAR